MPAGAQALAVAGLEPQTPEAVQARDALAALEARYQARLLRERNARKQAEKLLEERSLALYTANQSLKAAAADLEQQVQARTVQLQEALANAQAATEAKSRFLATMSHEIRTPMNGILGLSELLSHQALETQQAQYVDTIRKSGEGLLVLLNDILDFSKIEANQLVLEAAPVALRDELEGLRLLLAPQAAQKGLDLQFRVDPDVPRWVVGDSVRLRQVWLNLLTNALKFTERGSVAVELVCLPGRPGWLQSSVSDTGIGIAPDTLDRIFEPFVQADSSTTRRFGGTGLGLVICRRIVELMGGQLTLTSRLGAGSRFVFEWPVSVPEPVPGCGSPSVLTVAAGKESEVYPSSGGASTLTVSVASLANLQVLLVEDHPVNRQLAKAQLLALGVSSVAVAVDGEQALERLRHAHFDVVLMDMHMPKLDGLSATQQLRACEGVHQPWIISMTANAFEEDRQACLAAGMNDFLPKPVSVPALRAALTRFLVSG